MSNNAQDYEDNLVFPPQEIKSADDLNKQGRESDVLVSALEKCEKLEKQLKIAVGAINSSAEYLACMEDLSDFNDGKCNEQMALEALNEALAKIKDIK